MRRRSATSARWSAWRCRTSPPPPSASSVAVALIRGIAARSGKTLGNFYGDVIRTILYVLLPLSIIVALILLSQGVIQNFHAYVSFHGLTGLVQTIAQGPVASQEAIKELGTNGGGFFNVNSAHPFENPTGFSNFLEMLSMLIIPAGLVFAYGRMVGARRQGITIFSTMMVMFLGAAIVCLHRRGPRLPGSARGRPAHRRRPAAPRAATSRARSSASASPARRCSMSSPR